ncbi:hypothetical protein STEG23_029449, partial [Scotinomys teguina]
MQHKAAVYGRSGMFQGIRTTSRTVDSHLSALLLGVCPAILKNGKSYMKINQRNDFSPQYYTVTPIMYLDNPSADTRAPFFSELLYNALSVDSFLRIINCIAKNGTPVSPTTGSVLVDCA